MRVIIDIPDMRNKMTKDEAISMLERMRFPEPWEPKLTKKAEEALDMAINALSAIYNIKAEIIKKHFSIAEEDDFDNGRTYGYEECLSIIDKHMEKEGG